MRLPYLTKHWSQLQAQDSVLTVLMCHWHTIRKRRWHVLTGCIPPSLSLETCLLTSWPVIAAFMRTLWIHRFHRNGKQLVIQMESSMAFNQPQLPRDVPWYIHGSFHHGMWSEFSRPYPFVEVGGSSSSNVTWIEEIPRFWHRHTHMTFVWRWGTPKRY